MKLAGLILAAGASRRMGRPKALLDLNGETFLDRLIGLYAEVSAPVVVVLGYEAAAIRAGLRRACEAIVVENPDPARGQLSSVQCGLRAIEADGVLFGPVDYPAVQLSTLVQLAVAFAEGAPLAVPRHGGLHGHPVVIGRALIDEILSLPPEAQARDVIRRHAARYIDVEDAGVLDDVDDPEAYRLLRTRS